MRLSIFAAHAVCGALASELHDSVAQGEHRMVLRLARLLPAQVDMLDENGLTPLMMAAQRGYETIVRALLELNASPDLRGFRMMTALHHAVIQKHLTVADALLEANAAPNLQMDDGRTPLHYAATCCPQMVSKLLKYGANPNTATPRCTLPLHMSLMSLLSAGYSTGGFYASGVAPRHYDLLLGIVDELVSMGSHTGIRTLSSNLSPPRGVSARELVE